MKNKITPGYLFKIGGRLLLIAALTALMLAFVYQLTAEKIAANAEKEMLETVEVIFGKGASTEEVEGDFGNEVLNVYKVTQGGELLGYSVKVVSLGFKGDIEMIVALEPDMTCKSVSVISYNETPGLGSKAADHSFLDQFVGKSGVLAVKKDIDAVAGATVSSKAVTEGVNSALAVGEILSGGEQE